VTNAWLKYSQAAWLINDLYSDFTNPGPSGRDFVKEAADQYAAWSIFDDSAHASTYLGALSAAGYGSDPNFTQDFNNDYATALSDATNGPPLGWDVVTYSDDGAPAQEFLTRDEPGFSTVATPEPVSIFLLGTVLLGLGFAARRHLKHKHSGLQQ
jgi:hypothetical protein